MGTRGATSSYDDVDDAFANVYLIMTHTCFTFLSCWFSSFYRVSAVKEFFVVIFFSIRNQNSIVLNVKKIPKF